MRKFAPLRTTPPRARQRRQEDMGLLSRADQVQHDAMPAPDPKTAPPATETSADPPARAPGQVCPVIGRPVCYYGDCYHWTGYRCGHPAAAGTEGARRARARRAAVRTAAVAGA